jgi:hypothetical protein
LVAEKTQGEIIMAVSKPEGIPVRSYETYGNGLVPEDPGCAPAGGHRVETAEGACCDQHPVGVDQFKEILMQRFYSNIGKLGIHVQLFL